MFGCHLGKLFQVTVSGGSYQEALTATVQGVPPGMEITEEEIYGDLLLRKPGADELVELVISGVPAGLGEPVLDKLDGELGRMMGIGAVKGVEIGAGFRVKDMTGYECNDRMRGENGRVVFDSNNAGGITGGLATGQDIVVRLAVKPTPTIDKKQHTIDKYTMETTELSAITRRDPTITNRIWPVAENFAALIVLDQLIAHYGYQKLRETIKE